MPTPPIASLEPALAQHWWSDVAACRAVLRRHSKTFHAASVLLPLRVRAPASVLYGFCRLADDAVDESEGGPGQERAAVRRLQQRLDRVYAGQPEAVPADRALAGVVVAYAIPKALPEFLLDGLAWDAEGREYDTLDQLLAYAARVAGAVGAMMSLLMETRSPAALARACDLGVAMQLSNIARDVGDDLRLGRLYLPKDWLREAGMDDAAIAAWRAAPRRDARVEQVVLRLVDEADRLYARAAAGVASLPLACRPGINAARLMYAAIGHRVRAAGGDGLTRRARVGGWHKLALVLQGSVALRPSRAALHAPPLAAHQVLLDAVAQQPGPMPQGAADFVLTLFDRLSTGRGGTA
ncbi:phytoene/squalene synthase family protein [Leptothrix discophora]|uniref:Phytoene/squalene synthase family protein n=1 Tax=Leptothrix discophora TaxID=89 RepID=A0ABT9G4I3_LEPDI|nr:phytoene/squalene synthase family protein [Leptothrix discophora]MDP4301389.1 phytoene/squalene synthase family protein [Leptothrix discophora]